MEPGWYPPVPTLSLRVKRQKSNFLRVFEFSPAIPQEWFDDHGLVCYHGCVLMAKDHNRTDVLALRGDWITLNRYEITFTMKGHLHKTLEPKYFIYGAGDSNPEA